MNLAGAKEGRAPLFYKFSSSLLDRVSYPNGLFKRGSAPLKKESPLPLTKGKGIQGIGWLILVVGGSPAQ